MSSEKRANVARNYFQRHREPSEDSDDTVKLEDIQDAAFEENQ